MLSLKAENRIVSGKKVDALRSEGKIPAVVYGKGIDTEMLAVPYADFVRIWREAGESSLVMVDTGDKKHNVLISEVQFDPIKNTPLHIDFHAVRMDEKIVATVPVEFEGESPAVKQEGGVLVKVIHELDVEALPADLPGEIIIDISGLKAFEDRIIVSDIKLKEGVVIQADPEEVVVLVSAPREEAEEETAKSIDDIEVTTERKEEDGEGGESAEKETSADAS
ncbi:MAG: 50S ribosomal protein L25 [Candidatus Niyogibacteria bacterium CG10_big_fil_rev_8_21_14_0_10_46_36]|uniref:Large ribosomal subunit protein bL25 n=1 Tax=Candidatus Niyogibacteria bacterium CG10_big_fil_rev_8_21_14_0_10_46_36 TaxID=1974726 RepID=A0A2H0TFB4_9BACT|nr:MAG: 50S ribosomal protein L25 [Candidatus Niyogibacteria bacterium CG10_big_fil_rev_8_21_14_0_10_46_36]